MQKVLNGASEKKNYDFIDAIRCIAMIGIVSEHSVGTYAFAIGSPLYWAQIVLMQAAKFGTIAFFLLAGFLISDKFTTYTPGEYLRRRVSTTVGPWVFWSLIYVIAMIINMAVKERIYHRGDFNVANVLHNIEIVYLYTNYWFIINFLVSITILLVFRRHLYQLYFGLILLVFTLFYSVNIHYQWIESGHTTAILGFVFFLWLGAQLRKNWDQIEAGLSKVPYGLFVFMILLTFGMAVFEAHQLAGRKVDPLNTLRISCVLYSLSVFVLLLKIKTFKFTAFLKPRQTTFGIYLIHYIILIFVLPEILIHFNLNEATMTVPQFVVFKTVSFLIVYAITFTIVRLIGLSKAKVLVGN